MTDPYLDQLEFRWRPDGDLSLIATSIEDFDTNDRWKKRLHGYTGFSIPERGMRVAGSSAVYLTFPDEKAALVLRELDDDAEPLFDTATPDRERLVARALVGARANLTSLAALQLTAARLDGLLLPRPGKVDVNGDLAPVHLPDLLLQVNPQMHRLYPDAGPDGLAQLIAAVLREPDRPVTFLLDQGSLDRIDSPAAPLIWAMHQLVAPILLGPDRRPGFGWRPTFSTFETPSDRKADALPWVTFQLPPPRGARPLGDPPTTVHANSDFRNDLPANAARVLVSLYEGHGPEKAAQRVHEIVQYEDALDGRLRSLCGAASRDQQQYSPSPGLVRRIEQHSTPVPAEQPQSRPSEEFPGPAPTAPATPVRRVPSNLDLPALYSNLARHAEAESLMRDAHAKGVQGYRLPPEAQIVLDLRATFNWFRFATDRGERLRPDQTGEAIRILTKHGPALTDWLTTSYGTGAAGEHLADVLFPIFASNCQQEPASVQGHHNHLKGNPLVAQAVPVLCSLLPPEAARHLGENALLPLAVLVQPPRGTGRDDFGDAGGSPRRENALLTQLTRAGAMIPEWVAAVLALVLVLEVVVALTSPFWF